MSQPVDRAAAERSWTAATPGMLVLDDDVEVKAWAAACSRHDAVHVYASFRDSALDHLEHIGPRG